MTFPKSCFPSIFGGYLEFLRKHKNAFISEIVQDRAISAKFLTHRVSTASIGDFSKKKVFPPFVAAKLNFC